MANKKAPVQKNDGYVQGFAQGLQRADGWMNCMTGLGTMKDARKFSQVAWRLMSELDCENFYGGDSMAAKIVNLVPEKALEKGYTLTGLDVSEVDDMIARAKELDVNAKFLAAAQQARMYGGCALLKSYNDDLMLQRPMTPGSELKALIPFHRFMMLGQWEDLNTDILSPMFNTPLLYTFMPRGVALDQGMALTKIHYTRVIRFDGSWLPDRLRQANGYWGDTVLGRLFDEIRNYADAHDSANALLKDISVAVFKVKDLADQIASDGGEQSLITRMEIVNLCKAIARAVVVDAEGEDFDYKARSVTGVTDLVGAAENRLCAASGIPKTVLLGISPQGGGLGQSGTHDEDNFHSMIASYQNGYLRPKLLEMFTEIGAELGIDVSGMDIKFNPLEMEDSGDVAATRLKTAQTDQIYVLMGAADPSEIRTSRFGGDAYSAETVIDPSLDKALQMKSEADPNDPNEANEPPDEENPKNPESKTDGATGSGPQSADEHERNVNRTRIQMEKAHGTFKKKRVAARVAKTKHEDLKTPQSAQRVADKVDAANKAALDYHRAIDEHTQAVKLSVAFLKG